MLQGYVYIGPKFPGGPPAFFRKVGPDTKALMAIYGTQTLLGDGVLVSPAVIKLLDFAH